MVVLDADESWTSMDEGMREENRLDFDAGGLRLGEGLLGAKAGCMESGESTIVNGEVRSVTGSDFSTSGLEKPDESEIASEGRRARRSGRLENVNVAAVGVGSGLSCSDRLEETSMDGTGRRPLMKREAACCDTFGVKGEDDGESAMLNVCSAAVVVPTSSSVGDSESA